MLDKGNHVHYSMKQLVTGTSALWKSLSGCRGGQNVQCQSTEPSLQNPGNQRENNTGMRLGRENQEEGYELSKLKRDSQMENVSESKRWC